MQKIKIANNQFIIEMPKRTFDKNCKSITKGYSNYFGITVSNFYTLSDSLKLKVKESENEIILFSLKPIYFKIGETNCISDEVDNIILVIVYQNKPQLKVEVLENVLSRKDVTLGLEEIVIKNKTLIIKGDYGHSNKLFYKTYISFKENTFFVDSINLEIWKNKQITKTYNFDKKLPLSKFNNTLIDSFHNELYLY